MDAYIMSLITFCAGLLLGNRLAIGRDKRKEFNAAAQPIRGWLIKESKKSSHINDWSDIRWPSDIDIDKFISCLPILRRRGFIKAYKHQEKVRDEQEARTDTGAVFYKDPEVIIEAVKKCLPYTKRR